MADAELADRPPRSRARPAHLDLGELEVGPGRSGHGVEERGHLRLEHEVRHHLSRRGVREHNPVGAGEGQLPLGVRAGGASDDRQVGTRRARREDDVEVVHVGVGSGHEPLRAFEPGFTEVFVVSHVALDEKHPIVICGRHRVLVEVEHHVGNIGRAELLAHATPHAAVPADDEVVVQVLDRPLPPPFGQRARDDAAGDRLEDNCTRVGDDRHPSDDEDERDDPRAVVARDRVQPGERDGDDTDRHRMQPAAKGDPISRRESVLVALVAAVGVALRIVALARSFTDPSGQAAA